MYQVIAVNPQKLVFALALGWLFCIGAGLFLMAKGVRGFCEGRMPLTSSMDLTGLSARLAALFFFLSGAICSAAGLTGVAFVLWRMLVAR